jgi:aspartate/methionine/tyrosine aminotransferase
VLNTPYIEWAKLPQAAAFNLAVSGMPHASFEDIGGIPADMPLAGSNSYGFPPLLEQIARTYGVQPAGVVTTTGCSMANYLALATLVAPGDEVLIERPTYEPLLRVAEHLGAVVSRFDRPPDNDCRLNPHDVIARLTPQTRVIVIANLHNPSSQFVPDSALQEIGEAATRVGARVLVDEVYLDAVFDQARRSCVHLGPAFVSTSSLTKVYGLSALRCGWILADEELAKRAWRLSDLYGNVQPFTPDWLAARAFTHLPKLRDRARRLLETNRNVFEEWARARVDIDGVTSTWGTTVLVRPHVPSVDAFCERLRDHYEVTVVPGGFFEAAAYIRIGLSVEPALLREGLTRLGDCLSSFTQA